MNLALLQFPGSNCEWETKRAAEAAGQRVDIFRWNRDPSALLQYDGYLLCGGFSYQDRVRAGAIASKEPILQTLCEQALAGKPVLGICNGAQVLVEAGLIPGLNPGAIEMALAPNRPDPAHRISYYCARWVWLKLSAPPQRCVWTAALAQGAVFPLPISHGEGRYTTGIPGLLDKLQENEQVVLQYCTPDGETVDDCEANPNGAALNLAGVCNPAGNVLAMMPHPERASWLRQVPAEIGGEWAQRKLAGAGDASVWEQAGPGQKLFQL